MNIVNNTVIFELSSGKVVELSMKEFEEMMYHIFHNFMNYIKRIEHDSYIKQHKRFFE